MRIAYVNHSRFPTEKAHGLQVAHVCKAMAALGHEVTLVTPTMRGADATKAFEYYGMEKTFRIEQLRHFDPFASAIIPGVLGFAIAMRVYAKALQKYLKQKQFDVLYVRSPLLVRALISTGIPVAFEIHALPRFAKWRFVKLCNRCKIVICLTAPMRDELQRWGVSLDRMIVEGDGVDLDRFQKLPSTAAAKKQWKFPLNRTLIGYAGSLVTRETLEKGVRELIDALALVRQTHPDVIGWIIGGSGQWLETYKQHARAIGLTDDAIRFEGYLTASSVPAALAACDILVYPAPASRHPFFQRDTSPLKLFEYLATGKPVVCAELPPLKGVVDKNLLRFVAPGDPSSIAEGLIEVMEHPIDAKKRAEAGKKRAEQYSWTRRMARILDSLR